ncbi:C-type mannose receptor 2-like [Haliotis asinina]|uniref:C-type mannose receptor 2-like n=1 Tax=Haliotis asinina TaxID=109174 RepID=UPI003532225B
MQSNEEAKQECNGLIGIQEVGGEEECSEKGHRYSKIGDLCYRQSTTMMNWENAQRDCEKLGGTLFNIDSPEKHNFFDKVVRRETRSGKNFIGASRTGDSGAWTWTDGRNIELSYWLPKEPDYIILVPQNCAQYEERDMEYLWDKEECHLKGHRFAQTEGLCYRQSIIKRYWENAQRDCEKLGGTLFNIDSPAKHNFFDRVVKRETSGKPLFVGASRANASAKWTWTDGGDIERFYWLPDEPDYTVLPQNCVQYEERDMKYLWDSTLCKISKHYYCHYPDQDV